MEKYKGMQIYLMYANIHKEDCNFFSNFIPWIEIIYKILKPKVSPNTLSNV